jgi:hypothetical protein
MHPVSRIGLLGIALVAVIAMLAGCGSGGDPSQASVRLRKLEQARCEVFVIERALDGLEAGISATGREFGRPAPGVDRRQILRGMKEEVEAIRGRLPLLENCPQTALPLAEGKPVPEAPAPSTPRGIAVAHRVGPGRVEPGEEVEVLSARPCPNNGVNGTTTFPINSDVGACAQVAPGGRLSFVNYDEDGVPVQVRVGDYELWLEPGQRGTIPGPASSYLGRGGHPVRVAGALGGTIFVLNPGCVLRPEQLKPGEELCFPPG